MGYLGRPQGYRKIKRFSGASEVGEGAIGRGGGEVIGPGRGRSGVGCLPIG